MEWSSLIGGTFLGLVVCTWLMLAGVAILPLLWAALILLCFWEWGPQVERWVALHSQRIPDRYEP